MADVTIPKLSPTSGFQWINAVYDEAFRLGIEGVVMTPEELIADGGNPLLPWTEKIVAALPHLSGSLTSSVYVQRQPNPTRRQRARRQTE
jgi:hypothetical protein